MRISGKDSEAIHGLSIETPPLDDTAMAVSPLWNTAIVVPRHIHIWCCTSQAR
ncbi:MAG: hypothetical protein J5503_06720 [Muribaculaceae bacterium]|nr:hypothetical protein [Muribaculaceae bacterium]